LSWSIWEAICRFFHHDRDKIACEYQVKIYGMARKLLPVQAHAVWWILRMHYKVHNSAFLAHIMGIGKTTIAYAVHITQHIFNLIFDEIKLNSAMHSNAPLTVKCPSNDKILMEYRYDCPCWKESPTSFMKPSLGVTICLIPNKTFAN
jgi:hypothetical protein